MITITTSWDDGHPLDERLAERLRHHGLAATFYVPTRCDRPVLDRSALRRLASLGFEIGGHTVTHRVLTSLGDSEALAEMRDNRLFLEDTLGSPVTSFCYPCGRFSRRLMGLARAAGFQRARTTMGLRSDRGEPFALPVTVQNYPHGHRAHLTHAIKEGNLRGMTAWLRDWAPSDPSRILAQACGVNDGIVHLWGHSWELEEQGLWPLFERLAAQLSGVPRACHLANDRAYT